MRSDEDCSCLCPKPHLARGLGHVVLPPDVLPGLPHLAGGLGHVVLSPDVLPKLPHLVGSEDQGQSYSYTSSANIIGTYCLQNISSISLKFFRLLLTCVVCCWMVTSTANIQLKLVFMDLNSDAIYMYVQSSSMWQNFSGILFPGHKSGNTPPFGSKKFLWASLDILVSNQHITIYSVMIPG